MLKIFSFITALCYLAACGAFLRVYVTENARLRRKAKVIVAGAVAVHLAYLIAFSVAVGHFPLTNVFEALTTLALMIVLAFVYVDYRVGARSVGILIFFFSFVVQLVSSFFISFEPGAYDMMPGVILPAHVCLALLGYAAFATAFLYSVMYLLLHRNIKAGRFGRLFRRFPSLEELDLMNYRAIQAGLVLLFLSIILGFAWSYETFSSLPFWDAKVTFTLFTWTVYAVLIVFKEFFGWHGWRNAVLSACGFVLVMVSFTLVNALAGSFHMHF